VNGIVGYTRWLLTKRRMEIFAESYTSGDDDMPAADQLDRSGINAMLSEIEHNGFEFRSLRASNAS
jgi:hypothetical protein